MIRINLLEETRVAAKAKAGAFALPKFEVAENVPVIMLGAGVALAVTGVLVGWLYYQQRLADLDKSIAKAEAERQRLERVLKQSEELNNKKADLNRKIQLISELKAKVTVPVKMLDHVSKNLPDHVWFDELNFSGETITLRGKAQTPIAVSNLLRSLEESEWFTDEALGRVTNEKGLTTFSLTVTFRPPAPPAPAGAAAGATTVTTPAAPPASEGAAAPRRRR